MTQILNLDAFEQSEDKTVILKGVKHAFQPFSVDEFISQLKTIKDMEAGGEMDLVAYVEFSVSSIKRAFPTIPEPDLRALSVGKLKALMDFVKKEAESEEAAGSEALSGNGEGEAS